MPLPNLNHEGEFPEGVHEATFEFDFPLIFIEKCGKLFTSV